MMQAPHTLERKVIFLTLPFEINTLNLNSLGSFPVLPRTSLHPEHPHLEAKDEALGAQLPVGLRLLAQGVFSGTFLLVLISDQRVLWASTLIPGNDPEERLRDRLLTPALMTELPPEKEEGVFAPSLIPN